MKPYELSDEVLGLITMQAAKPVLRHQLEEPVSDEAWEAARLARKASATHFTTVHYFYEQKTGGIVCRHGWITYPDSLRRSLREISRLTRAGSEMDSIMKQREGSRTLTRSFVEELKTNLAYDGFHSHYERLMQVIRGESPATTVAEMVALNYLDIMFNLPTLDCGPELTPEFVDDLYCRLVDGLPRNALPEFACGTPIPTFHALSLDAPYEEAVATVCALFNGRLSSPDLDPVLLSFDLNCFHWFYRAFPMFNNLMGCVLSRYLLCREGYPVFRYLPKALIYKRWSSGELSGSVPYGIEEAFVFDDDSMDYTPVYDVVMRLMVESLEEIRGSLRGLQQADDAVIGAIERMPNINLRQAEILRKAVIDSEATFFIKSHQERYHVAYSTARADLMKLVQRGLLTESYRGSAICYRPAPRLKTTLLEA